MITDLWHRLQALLFPGRAEREMAEELQDHLAREAEARRAAGSTSPTRDAALALGGVERVKEEVRDATGVRYLHDFLADVRYALRALRRNPAFTITVIAVLGLAIAATTTVFTVVNRVLLAQLPYPEPERLFRIRQKFASTLGTLSVVDIQAIRDQQQSFDAFGAVRFGNAAVPGAEGPELVIAGRVTSGFFKALGVRAAYGRLLEPDDDVPGAQPMVVVSYAYAERSLGGAANAVGKGINIDGLSHTVAGVLEPGRRDIIGIRASVWPILRFATPERRGPFGLNAVARLKEGVTVEQATRDLESISIRIFPQWKAGFQDSTARFVPQPLRTAVIGNARQPLGLFAGAVALVLLLAVANVATLFLVRASAREHELAVRVALGANRPRIARLVLTEGITLTVLAGLLGLGLTAMGLQVVSAVAPGLPRLGEVAIDARTVGFALLLALVCGVLVSAASLFSVLGRRSALASALVSSPARGGASRRTNLVRGILVTSEFALALPLLLGAALLASSFLRLQRVDAGFDPRGVAGLDLSLPSSRYSDSTLLAFWQRAESRALEVEGVTAAGLSSNLPPDNFGDVNNFDLLDRPVPAGTTQPVSPWPAVTNGYFDVMGIPLLEGRWFTMADTATGAPVILVSRSWAAKFYPGESALGKQLYSGGCTTCPPNTIVGIVGDVLYQGLAGDGVAAYAPLPQQMGRSLSLVVRTSAGVPATIRGLRTGMATLDPDLAPSDIIMSERMEGALGDPRRWAAIVGTFAAAGAFLAALGVFGLMSYVVRQRQRELGVRIALGATPSSLTWLVLSRGLRYAAIGTTIGLVIALLQGRWLASMLYGVRPNDPLTMVGAVILLLLIASVACLIPGLRAARIRPVEALSGD